MFEYILYNSEIEDKLILSSQDEIIISFTLNHRDLVNVNFSFDFNGNIENMDPDGNASFSEMDPSGDFNEVQWYVFENENLKMNLFIPYAENYNGEYYVGFEIEFKNQIQYKLNNYKNILYLINE